MKWLIKNYFNVIYSSRWIPRLYRMTSTTPWSEYSDKRTHRLADLKRINIINKVFIKYVRDNEKLLKKLKKYVSQCFFISPEYNSRFSWLEWLWKSFLQFFSHIGNSVSHWRTLEDGLIYNQDVVKNLRHAFLTYSTFSVSFCFFKLSITTIFYILNSFYLANLVTLI